MSRAQQFMIPTAAGAGGAAFATSITPTLGSNLITNGEFTTNTTGWSVNAATIAQVDSTIDPGSTSGGADDGAGKIVAEANFSSFAFQATALVAGDWALLQARAYAPSANVRTNAAAFSMFGAINELQEVSAEDVWQAFAGTLRVTGSETARLQISGNSAGDIGYFDAVVCRKITLSTAFATPTSGGSSDGVSANLTVPAHYHGGVVRNLDSADTPANFIIGYIDGTGFAYLEKCVAGVWTTLINRVAITPVADAELQILRPSGNTFQLWYNGAQVGTDQTVNDAGIIDNTLYAQFATNEVVEFSNFSVA